MHQSMWKNASGRPSLGQEILPRDDEARAAAVAGERAGRGARGPHARDRHALVRRLERARGAGLHAHQLCCFFGLKIEGNLPATLPW